MVRIMIGAGGTGGHVYPALAVVEALYRDDTRHEITFIGTRGGGGFEKRLVDGSGLRFVAYGEVLAGPVVGINPFKAVMNIGKMLLGTLQAMRFMWQYKPQVILLTGGWANVPMAFAARLQSIPILVYLPDIEPGRTIQLISRFASRVAITVPQSAQYFRDGQTVVTGYPLRQQLLESDRASAQQALGLSVAHKTVLVTGGSRGARSINQAIEAILPELLADGVQIYHITGKLDWERSQTMTQPILADHPNRDLYQAVPYSDTMGMALAVADLVIARSGASSLGEFPHFGLPSILVPYPYAWRYQRTNADYLADQGAAYRLDDEKMIESLLPMIRRILHNEVQHATMQAAARQLAVQDGASHIARELLTLGVT